MLFKNLEPEVFEDLKDSLKDFMAIADVEDVHYVVMIHKGKDNEILSNSCLVCHVETLVEMIEKKDIKHNHEN